MFSIYGQHLCGNGEVIINSKPAITIKQLEDQTTGHVFVHLTEPLDFALGTQKISIKYKNCNGESSKDSKVEGKMRLLCFERVT